MATINIEFSVLFVIMLVTFTSSADACLIQHIWITDGSYPCAGMLDPAFQIGFYHKRKYLCNTYKLTYCCHTCKLVNEALKEQELRKQALQTKEIKQPLVAENQLPNVTVSASLSVTTRPEHVR
ncbi:hypothetical protein ACJMK2_040375 [Sinanodonta woodiana]|uniref:Uncharacterized protein n=1 Tax=Sinanodonta woodiana TaxID=1069815 RepID=A0ABD3WEV1_SINWO